MNRRHIGSNLDDFLAHEGLLAECEAGTLKRVVTWQIYAMKKIPGGGFKLAGAVHKKIDVPSK